MAVKVGINGFGRIGRLVFRVLSQDDFFEVVAVNDLADAKLLAPLLQYDSVHRKFPAEVKADGSDILVGGKRIKVLSEKNPANLPWKELGVQMVLESTGVFRKRAEIARHLEAGASKVLLSVPAKDDIDATIVLGVNDDALKPDAQILSNASCTTNSLAPMVKVLNDTFGIKHGLMTTIHAYTNDQKILDFIHTDPRRARNAATNIIPTTTGAARAIGKVIPALDGKLDGMAMRVPVMDGSVTDLTVRVEKPATADAVNAAMKAAASGPMKGIMLYSEEPLVSSDIIGDTHSCIFDAPNTLVIGDTLVKVLGWYDNEWGYSNRCVDLMKLAMQV